MMTCPNRCPTRVGPEGSHRLDARPGGITLGLVEAGRAGMHSPYVWTTLLGGLLLLLLLLFLWIERASPAPMLPLRLGKAHA